MTIALYLGTSKTEKEIYEVAEMVGFSLEKIDQILKEPIPIHKTVAHLRLQIHLPSFHKGVEGIITEIEFDDLSDKNREEELKNIISDDLQYYINSEAIEVLDRLYKKIPDLVYLRSYKELCNAEDPAKVERPPLSHYFEILKNKKTFF